MHNTLPLLKATDFPAISRGSLETLQVNLGYLCNQSCLHCHVNAGPARKEVMAAEIIDAVIAYLTVSDIRQLDLTGGAPELNPDFQRLVKAAVDLNIHVIDRCNLTVLLEPEMTGMAEFLAENQVEVIASLPCYLEKNVDKQRGDGVFESSLEALRLLNKLGYGQPGSSLSLQLVFNPQGPILPPEQGALEMNYKRHLLDDYGIVFSRLLTITNMPIKRFGSTLVSKGAFNEYMSLLKNAHKDENLPGVMCKSLISVDWQGYLYDCDFNQMLGIPVAHNGSGKVHIRDLSKLNMEGRPIQIADHCYGCTAGFGSSCSGALDA